MEASEQLRHVAARDAHASMCEGPSFGLDCIWAACVAAGARVPRSWGVVADLACRLNVFVVVASDMRAVPRLVAPRSSRLHYL